MHECMIWFQCFVSAKTIIQLTITMNESSTTKTLFLNHKPHIPDSSALKSSVSGCTPELEDDRSSQAMWLL